MPNALGLEGESPVASRSYPEHSMISQPNGPASLSIQSIPTDMEYIAERRVLTAVLEVPGVSTEDLDIDIRTIRWSRTTVLTVTANKKPYFPSIQSLAQTASKAASYAQNFLRASGTCVSREEESSQMSVRERKYGQFSKEIPVPESTRVGRFLVFSGPRSVPYPSCG
jgi:HSP20 family molecular chaperone IbpA